MRHSGERALCPPVTGGLRAPCELLLRTGAPTQVTEGTGAWGGSIHTPETGAMAGSPQYRAAGTPRLFTRCVGPADDSQEDRARNEPQWSAIPVGGQGCRRPLLVLLLHPLGPSQAGEPRGRSS